MRFLAHSAALRPAFLQATNCSSFRACSTRSPSLPVLFAHPSKRLLALRLQAHDRYGIALLATHWRMGSHVPGSRLRHTRRTTSGRPQSTLLSGPDGQVPCTSSHQAPPSTPSPWVQLGLSAPQAPQGFCRQGALGSIATQANGTAHTQHHEPTAHVHEMSALRSTKPSTCPE